MHTKRTTILGLMQKVKTAEEEAVETTNKIWNCSIKISTIFTVHQLAMRWARGLLCKKLSRWSASRPEVRYAPRWQSVVPDV